MRIQFLSKSIFQEKWLCIITKKRKKKKRERLIKTQGDDSVGKVCLLCKSEDLNCSKYPGKKETENKGVANLLFQHKGYTERQMPGTH